MFAGFHILKTTPEQNERGLELVRDQLLPWLRDSTGYRGLIRLSDSAREKTLGATRPEVEQYEATLFDL